MAEEKRPQLYNGLTIPGQRPVQKVIFWMGNNFGGWLEEAEAIVQKPNQDGENAF